jgi:hypothetical protein
VASRGSTSTREHIRPLLIHSRFMSSGLVRCRCLVLVARILCWMVDRFSSFFFKFEIRRSTSSAVPLCPPSARESMFPFSLCRFFTLPWLPISSPFPFVLKTDCVSSDFLSSWTINPHCSSHSFQRWPLYSTSLASLDLRSSSSRPIPTQQPLPRFNTTTSALPRRSSARRTVLFGFNLERS